MLTQERVKELFDYDPETGVLIRKIASSRNSKIGDIAGWTDKKGYRSLKIDWKTYKVHRVIWLWMTGKMPVGEIDHDNRQKSDNRWKNLKDVTGAENTKNKKLYSSNKSGCAGVFFRESPQSWSATISANGKRFRLGCFKDLADAINARKQAELKYGFHPNHGI